jgi:hypothetical protein
MYSKAPSNAGPVKPKYEMVNVYQNMPSMNASQTKIENSLY